MSETAGGSEYDVALSFAGEDRKYVAAVAAHLLAHDMKVFYDEFEIIETWGAELSERFDDVYRLTARYTVVFVSKHYARKPWTRHEHRSAQARALFETRPYLLPVRLDNSELPGLRPTVGYIDARRVPPAQLADLIERKVRGLPAPPIHGKVRNPRSQRRRWWGTGMAILGLLAAASVPVRRALNPTPVVPPCAGAIRVAAGEFYSLALGSEGRLSAWGANQHGQLGDGTKTERPEPRQVAELPSVVAVTSGYYHALALHSDGTLSAWGWNEHGQLGDGTRTDRVTPRRIAGLTGVTAVAAGPFHTLAVGASGAVWAWGDNGRGQLGTGGASQEEPARVAGLSDVTAVAAGHHHSLALRRDGSVWAWGENDRGQLGDGSSRNRASPGVVAGLTDVTAVAAGYGHSLALRRDGTVWAWGYNNDGQLGDGTRMDQMKPVKVVGLAVPVTVIATGKYHSFALRRDGTVSAWGLNNEGQLGDGSKTDRMTPIQVSGLAGITVIAAGSDHSLAVGATGSTWAWGSNKRGQLGDGTKTSHTTASPSGCDAVPSRPTAGAMDPPGCTPVYDVWDDPVDTENHIHSKGSTEQKIEVKVLPAKRLLGEVRVQVHRVNARHTYHTRVTPPPDTEAQKVVIQVLAEVSNEVLAETAAPISETTPVIWQPPRTDIGRHNAVRLRLYNPTSWSMHVAWVPDKYDPSEIIGESATPHGRWDIGARLTVCDR